MCRVPSVAHGVVSRPRLFGWWTRDGHLVTISNNNFNPTHNSAGRTHRRIYIQKVSIGSGERPTLHKRLECCHRCSWPPRSLSFALLPCGLAFSGGHTIIPAQRRCNMKTLLLQPSLFPPDLTVGLTLLVLLHYTFSIGLLDYRIVRGTFFSLQLVQYFLFQ